MRNRQSKLIALIVLGVLLGGCNRSPEARRDKYIAAGKSFLEKKDYSRAILQFRNAVQAMPKDAEVYYQLGNGFLAIKDYTSAVMSYRKALEFNPKHPEAQLKIAQIYSMTDDAELWKDAQDRLKTLLEGSKQTPDMLNTLALTELKLGNTDSAIQNLEVVLAKNPGELSSAYLLARTKLSQKDPKGAEEVLMRTCSNAPKLSDARLLLGEFYVSQQRLPEAEAQMSQALQLDPKNGPALMELIRLQNTAGKKQEAEQNAKRLAALDGYQSVYGNFLFEQGRHDEAIREFERLAKKNPEDRQARTQLVVAYRLGNRAPEADQLLTDVLKKNPKDADALLQRGEIMIEKHDYARAEADLNEILRLRPKSPEVHYVIAKLNEARGKPLIYRQELAEALRLNPALLAVRVELAQNLVNSKEGTAALDLLNETPEYQKVSPAIAIQRNWAFWQKGDMAAMRKGIDQGLAQGKTVDLLIQDAVWKLRNGEAAAAGAAIEAALRIDPSDLRSLTVLSRAYAAQKNVPMAVEKVREYAAQLPKSAPVQDFLGLLFMGAGNTKAARTAFLTAKTADPRFTKADLSLVQLDVMEGKLDDARTRLGAFLKSDPNNTMATRWLATLEQAKGNRSAAIEHFRKVVAANPADPQASNNLAYLLSETGNQNDEALKYAQKAVELAPERPAYCDTLGWVLYKKGLYASAIPYLERASAHPEDVVWKYHLAMAYAKAGNSQRGRTMLDAALKVNPRVPEAKLAQDVVGSAAQ